MLGWWADETKGYQLEEVGTGKQITACNVCFVEDSSVDNLAVIESGGLPCLVEKLTDQLDNGGKKEPEPDEPNSPEPRAYGSSK